MSRIFGFTLYVGTTYIQIYQNWFGLESTMRTASNSANRFQDPIKSPRFHDTGTGEIHHLKDLFLEDVNSIIHVSQNDFYYLRIIDNENDWKWVLLKLTSSRILLTFYLTIYFFIRIFTFSSFHFYKSRLAEKLSGFYFA